MVEYIGHSGGWGYCAPGEQKSYSCPGCVDCTGNCIGLVDWCNENGEWVHARKVKTCQGTNDSILLFYLRCLSYYSLYYTPLPSNAFIYLACNPNPCNNGGICTDADANGTPECNCAGGFTGATCDTAPAGNTPT